MMSLPMLGIFHVVIVGFLCVVGPAAALTSPNAMLMSTPVSFGGTFRDASTFSRASLLRYRDRWTMSTLYANAESDNKQDDGVVELPVDDDEEKEESSVQASVEDKPEVVAPFLSQGEIAPESMEMDWSDPKQTRVMIYIILSLLPVLFLIPLMLTSRELIPLDMLPPVDM